MLFLHEGYVGDYDLSQKHNTKSTWNPSLGNILMILLDSLLDLSCNLQNSVTFLENFFLFTIRHLRGRKLLRVTRQKSVKINKNPILSKTSTQKMNKLINGDVYTNNNPPLCEKNLDWYHPYLWQSFYRNVRRLIHAIYYYNEFNP